MDKRLRWERDGLDWPHREASRFVSAAGLRWHVQVMGNGPAMLLLHGTGSSTHTWRSLAPMLAEKFTIVAPDLPGHAFTDPLAHHRLSLPGMADSVTALLAEMKLKPEFAVGHSAGAAILTRMSLDGASMRGIVSINGAFLPFARLPSVFLTPVAKLFALNPLIPRLLAWRAQRAEAVQRLIDSTGSKLDDEGVELYVRLVRSSDHVAGALAMMAKWDLQPLLRELPQLRVPLSLIVGMGDKTVAPSEAERVLRRAPNATLVRLPALGHLAHEEAPEKVARAVLTAAHAALT